MGISELNKKKLQEAGEKNDEEITDMMSVEVKVDNTGARMTASNLAPRSNEGQNPANTEKQFVSPYSVKAMNLQAEISADKKSRQSIEGNIEIFAPHEQ